MTIQTGRNPFARETVVCDTEPGNYYVSIIRDGKTALLFGPCRAHCFALAMVDKTRRLAQDLDPWAAFDSFGTVRMADDYREPGKLNSRLGGIDCLNAYHGG